MKTAVVTIAIGEEYRAIAEITHPHIKSYADKIGADFIDINRRSISLTTPHFEKFQIYYLLNKYHRIIFIDTDILIRPDCPNLFDVVSEKELGAFNEGSFTDRVGAFDLVQQQYNCRINDWDGAYYNTGVMVISRIHKLLFKKPEMEISNFYEQSYLNLLIQRNKVKMKGLDYKFNRMTCLDSLLGEPRLASYMVHYAGCPNINTMCQLMLSDLEKWKNDAPDYRYKKNIDIQVHGGLGDEVCAEPVLRYLVEEVYPDDNVHITTWYPRIFAHFPVPVYNMGKFERKKDTPYFEIHTMAVHGCPSWRYISPNLTHTTDYSSFMCLRGTIPNDKKTIHLEIFPEDEEEVDRIVGLDNYSNCVLVHPGRGWPSKTFPAEYWEEIVERLSVYSQVILMGKHISDEQGVVRFNYPDSVIDTTNLLSLGGIISLIDRVPVLLSNDSAPIHLAGAFDNHIVLIPTCKPPDTVIPYRNGRQNYKSVSLYKKLVCDAIDSRPTVIQGQQIDWVDGDILDYLPDCDDVVKEVISRLP